MKTMMLIAAIFLTAKTAPFIRSRLGRLQWRRRLPVFAFTFALAWFGLSPTARAVDPPPNGEYLVQDTAEGQGALFRLTTGISNTAIGFKALDHNTTRSFATTNGEAALYSNATNRPVGSQAPVNNIQVEAPTGSVLTGSGRFHNTPKWTGSFSVTGSGGGEDSDYTWTVNQSGNGIFSLTPEPISKDPIGSSDTLVSVDDSIEAKKPEGITESWKGSGTVTTPVALVINEDICIYTLVLDVGYIQVTHIIPPETELVDYSWGPIGLNLETADIALPASGRTLSDSHHLTNADADGGGRGILSGDWDITWSVECDTEGALPVTSFTQNDPAWRTHLYDHSTTVTIWGKGCAMTALSMAMQFVGYPYNPDTLNSTMVTLGGFVNGGLSVDWTTATNKTSGGGLKFHPFRTSSTSDLDDVLCMGFPVIVGVKLSAGVPGHFVIVTGKQGNEFLIDDPAFNVTTNNKTKLSDYSSFESRGFVTEASWNTNPPCGTPRSLQTSATAVGDGSALTVTASNNVELLVVDPNGMRSGYDTTTGIVLEEIPGSVYFRDSLDNDQTGEPADEITHLVQIEHPVQGTYQVTVIGLHEGPYTVAIEPFSQDGSPQTPTVVQGTAPVGSSGSFQFQYSSTPTPGTGLGNISTRLPVETGDNVLIGGFIITGTQPKKVLLRAIGPSLPLAGKLADPTLELLGPGGLITSNDNWQDSPDKQEIIDRGFAPSNDLESAIVATLPANSPYTAILRGANNGTGIGLVEAYDLDLTVDSKLANISTRGFVQTLDDVMIGGFIVLGTDPQKMLIRAIGPSLPVAGKLADPTVELHDKNGATIASNDDWRSDQEADIIAIMLPPINDAESAILATLTPDAYTAIVRGKNETTGVALVEVYNVTP
jgi:hypothetical protein